MNRRSYRGLLGRPAWGLYAGDKIVASIRASNAYEARDLFRHHGLQGERVKRIAK